MKNFKNPLPLLALRELVFLPNQVIPLYVGREKSIKAIEEAYKSSSLIMLSAQKDSKSVNPKLKDIFEIGTVGEVIQLIRLADGPIKVLVEGKFRAKINSFYDDDFLKVDIEELESKTKTGAEIKSLIKIVVETFKNFAKISNKLSSETVVQISKIEDPSKLADSIASHLKLKLEDMQEVLSTVDVEKRLNLVLEHMKSEIEITNVEKKIRGRVKKQMEKNQKEYYLNEQMRAIQKELGDKDDFKNEVQELEDKLKAKQMPEEPRKKTQKEIRKLKMMSPMSAEASVVRNYIDWMLSLPWDEVSDEKIDLDLSKEILDEDHFGLEKVKTRILEYLAVQKLVGKIKGPILCLVGPPGVGKTSLGKSIAKSTGREFVRISLGGVRDEAEIRGHRRTYIGALPGKFIQSVKKAGKSNPVFLLDEIDKMASDFRGDPASALLEVLDPQQNNTFADHYLDSDYDLSKVMFVTTANSLNTIPQPLLDRMEVIRLSGYTEDEKLAISKKYLIPRQLEANGVTAENMEYDDDAIREVIRYYTLEAGVRNLERTISSICRKVAINVVKNDAKYVEKLEVNKVKELLGQRIFSIQKNEEKNQVGTVTALAWTSVGGAIMNIETSILPGKGRIQITGKLGDVMQESARAALSYVRSKSEMLGLPKYFYDQVDIHVHVPDGGTPKDGPSAGITIALSIISALTKIPVSRYIAMTGEISLRGNALPIGGLKEKALAAHRAGIKKILIPKDNEKDIDEIPDVVRAELEIVPVSNVEQVMFEGLICEGISDYQSIIETKNFRDDYLFAKSKESENKSKDFDSFEGSRKKGKNKDSHKVT